jgi:hypothetical protein
MAQTPATDQRQALTDAVQRFPTLWRNVSMEVLEGNEKHPPGSPDDREPTLDPSGVVTERKYSLTASGLDVRIDRDYRGRVADQIGVLRETQWFVNSQRYFCFGAANPTPLDHDQGSFSNHRGTLPTPLQYSYQRYDRWIGDFLDGFDWSTLKTTSNPYFGQVLTVDRNGEFGPETLQFWPKGGYMVVGVTFHGMGRAFQHVTTEAQQVQGIWFPKRAQELHFASEDTSQKPETKILYEVSSLHFNQELPADLFVPTWTEDSMVKDGEANLIYRVRNGKLVFDPNLNPGKSPFKPLVFVGSFGGLVGLTGYGLSKRRRAKRLPIPS